MTQADLAEKSDISVHYLGFIERGRAKPTLKTLHHIALAVGVRTEDLFRAQNTAKKNSQELIAEITHLLKRRRPEELRLFLTLIQYSLDPIPAEENP